MARPVIAHLAALGLVAAALAGCGGGDGSADAPPPAPRPSAAPQDFPRPGSRTLDEVRTMAEGGPILAPAVSVLRPGTNRFSFVLFDSARKALAGASVAVYLSRPDGTRVRGPYVARSESLSVKPQFRSRQTAADEEAGTPQAVYVADVRAPKAGDWVAMAVVRLDGRLLAADPVSVQVLKPGQGPPEVGDRAVRVSTPTGADVAGQLAEIDTRLPPVAEFHEQDLADVLGRRPVVLVFATPQLCSSRVCGPVYDAALQVKAAARGDIAWIQQEIYRDNDLNKGFRPQVAAWRLPTEPWVFVIDRSGTIVARFEGAISVGELQRAVAEVQ
jgi:hypothetical protein